MRKIISLLIIAIFTAIGCIPTAFANKTEDFKQEIEVLRFLKVVQDDDNEEFMPEELITRAQYVAMVMRLFKYDEVANAANSENRFTDISANHWAGLYVNLAANLGVIGGIGYGRFGVNEPISLQEATKVVLSCLGYKDYAESKGGYPLAYMEIARERDMINGIKKSGSEFLTCGEAAKLLFNSLDVSFMESIKKGDSYEFKTDEGQTILSQRQKMERHKGKVTANEFTSLNGQTDLTKHTISIDNVTYSTGDNDFNNYLGHNVVFFTDMLDSDKILYIYVDKNKNDEVYIPSSNISSIENGLNVKYRESSDVDSKLLSRKIEYNASVIENGVYKGKAGTTSITEDDLMPCSGGITLLDADTDGEAEVVFVDDYETYVVDGVSYTNKIIYDKYGKPNLRLDQDNNGIDISCRITRNGQSINLEDLKQWDVLSVAKASYANGRKQVINIIAESKKVIGIIEEKVNVTEDGSLEVVIDGSAYKVANNYYQNGHYMQNTKSLELNSKVTAYLNVDGQIAAIETADNQDEKIGYLVDFKGKESLESNYEFKIFTIEGNMQVFNSSDNLFVNGVKNPNLDTALQAKDASGIPLPDVNGKKVHNQLIKYRTNDDNKITEIKTAISGYNPNAFSLSYMSTAARIYTESNLVDGTYKISNTTIEFFIPMDATKDDEYRVMKPDLINGMTYNMLIYEVDSLYNAGIIVVKDNGGWLSYLKTLSSLDKPIILVDRVTKTVDSNGVCIYKIYGIYNGKQAEYTLKESLGNAGVGTGDIIRCNVNSSNEIQDLFLEYSAATDTYYNASNTPGFQERYSGTVTAPEVLWCYGRVTRVNGTSQIFVKAASYERRFDLGSTTMVYRYDTQRKKAELSSFDDIIVGDKVYANAHRGRTYEIVIYR